MVTRLRESLGSINEEIKSLLLCKDALERAFEHVRKVSCQLTELFILIRHCVII